MITETDRRRSAGPRQGGLFSCQRSSSSRLCRSIARADSYGYGDNDVMVDIALPFACLSFTAGSGILKVTELSTHTDLACSLRPN